MKIIRLFVKDPIEITGYTVSEKGKQEGIGIFISENHKDAIGTGIFIKGDNSVSKKNDFKFSTYIPAKRVCVHPGVIRK
jgi:hypothetical protein